MNNKTRYTGCNLNNPKYIDYHDNEWYQPNFDLIEVFTHAGDAHRQHGHHCHYYGHHSH